MEVLFMAQKTLMARQITCYKMTDSYHYRRDMAKTVTVIIANGKPYPITSAPIGYYKKVPIFKHIYDLAAYMEEQGYVVDGINT
jgi:hypothetical protein